jgi:hypothetical protein
VLDAGQSTAVRSLHVYPLPSSAGRAVAELGECRLPNGEGYLMSTISDILQELPRYAADRGLSVEISGAYDLFPERPHLGQVQPSVTWPAKWPLGNYHGVYLFFTDAPGLPGFRYVGKSSKRTSCIRVRLNGYVDMKEYRTSGHCVLRQEWKGKSRPWRTPPRYIVTVAMETDQQSNDCPEAERLESHLIQNFQPFDNVIGRITNR